MLRPDTQKFRLLELIGICGEFPADQLNRLFTSPSYAEKIITELKAEKLIHLSETEVMNITHFQRGNGLISTNNNNITVEFKASTLEKELITTDRQELLEIIERQKHKEAKAG